MRRIRTGKELLWLNARNVGGQKLVLCAARNSNLAAMVAVAALLNSAQPSGAPSPLRVILNHYA